MSGTRADARKRHEEPELCLEELERQAREDAGRLARAAEVCKAAGYRVVKLYEGPLGDDVDDYVTEEL